MPAQPETTEVRLSDDMKQALDDAFGSGKPVAIAYVDETGAPALSYRGSTQAFSDTQIAIWVRNPQGGLLEAIERNPAVALVYGDFDPSDRRFLIFRGRAHRDDSQDVRDRVYENSHPFERDQDKDRNGVAVLIDLESVSGFFGGERVDMKKTP